MDEKETGNIGAVELVSDSEFAAGATQIISKRSPSDLRTISVVKLKDEDQFILTRGLRSIMRDDDGEVISDKVFVRHWRPVFFFLYVVITSFIDARFNTNWWFSLLVLLSHISFLLVAVVIHFYGTKWFEAVPSSLITHNFRNYHIYHTQETNTGNAWTHKENDKERYEGSICWMFGVVNNWKMLDCRWLWINPIFGAYIAFGQMVINIIWGEHPAMLGCPTMANSEIASGACFIAHEWGIFISSMAFCGFAIANLFFWDITPYTIDRIKSVQHYKKKDDGDPYFECLKTARDSKSTFESTNSKIIAGIIIVLLSFHLLFWEFGSSNYAHIHRVESKVKFGAAIFLYIYMVPMWMFIFYFGWLTVNAVYMPFRDLSLIMTVFTYPLVIQSPQDIEVWWTLRSFYVNYVMPIYFRFGNALFFAYFGVSTVMWIILVWWSFSGDIDVAKIDYITALTVCIAVVFTLFLVVIAIKIASIYPLQQQHLEMLKKEKFRLICKHSQKNNGDKLFYDDWQFVQVIETVDKLITNHDAEPKIMGIVVNSGKIYLFVAYALSSIATVVVNNKQQVGL